MLTTKFPLHDYTLAFSKDFKDLLLVPLPPNLKSLKIHAFDLMEDIFLKISIVKDEYHIIRKNPGSTHEYELEVHPSFFLHAISANSDDGSTDTLGGLSIIDLRDNGKNTRIIYFLRIAPVYLKLDKSGSRPLHIISPGPRGKAFVEKNIAKAS